MKVECPQCHRIGILENRVNSQRVIHYEYINGRRVFTKHLIKGNGNSSMGTMGTELGTENVDNDTLSENEVGRERFELSTFRLSAERSSQAELPAHSLQELL